MAGKTIGREALVEALIDESGLSKAKADASLKRVINTITAALKKGDRVTLVGFGTFSTRKRKARTGRNPATGDTIKIKASTSVGFKAGATLKAAVQK